jgi:hypothetical protein
MRQTVRKMRQLSESENYQKFPKDIFQLVWTYYIVQVEFVTLHRKVADSIPDEVIFKFTWTFRPH